MSKDSGSNQVDPIIVPSISTPEITLEKEQQEVEDDSTVGVNEDSESEFGVETNDQDFGVEISTAGLEKDSENKSKVQEGGPEGEENLDGQDSVSQESEQQQQEGSRKDQIEQLLKMLDKLLGNGQKQEPQKEGIFSKAWNKMFGSKKEEVSKEEISQDDIDALVAAFDKYFGQSSQDGQNISSDRQIMSPGSEELKTGLSEMFKQASGEKSRMDMSEELDALKDAGKMEDLENGKKRISFDNQDAAKQFCDNYKAACDAIGIDCNVAEKEGGGYKLELPKECSGKDIFNMEPKDLEDLKSEIAANKPTEKNKENSDVEMPGIGSQGKGNDGQAQENDATQKPLNGMGDLSGKGNQNEIGNAMKEVKSSLEGNGFRKESDGNTDFKATSLEPIQEEENELEGGAGR